MGKFSIEYMINQAVSGTSDIHSHLLTLFALALNIKAKVIIELGVRGGESTIPLLLAAQKNGGKLHSVDIKDHGISSVPENLKKLWKFYKSDAIEFLKNWKVKADLVFVDDWHTYDHVKKELEIIETFITPSSLVILHDSMYYNYEPYYHMDLNETGQWADGGPYRALSELDKNSWEFSTIPSCHGLTILRKKPNKKFK